MTHTKTLHETSKNTILLSAAKLSGTAAKKGQTTPAIDQNGALYPLSGLFFLLLISTSHCK